MFPQEVVQIERHGVLESHDKCGRVSVKPAALLSVKLLKTPLKQVAGVAIYAELPAISEQDLLRAVEFARVLMVIDRCAIPSSYDEAQRALKGQVLVFSAPWDLQIELDARRFSVVYGALIEVPWRESEGIFCTVG